ncbi:sigma-E factor negative regulatory protein [Pseudomonadales bacterium]|nr:sigma-E factor negative regulatory protein [Pseudomonadales bacterium]
MTDTNKESLSALIDGEASEIEVHKLLRHVKSIEGEAGSISPETEDLHRSWARYQEIRSVIGPAGSRADGHSRMAASQHLALRLRISEAIDAEDTHKLEGVSSLVGLTPRSAMAKYRAPAAGLAIAASLVVAIFVGLSPLEQETGNVDAIATIDASADQQPVSVQTVSTTRSTAEVNTLEQQLLSSGDDGMLVDDLELKELNEEQRRQMRAYLQLHDRMTRTKPNRRTVNFKGTKE